MTSAPRVITRASSWGDHRLELPLRRTRCQDVASEFRRDGMILPPDETDLQERSMPTTKWTIRPGHSGIHFSVRHLVIAKVRGKFTKFEGTIELDEADLTRSQIDVSID